MVSSSFETNRILPSVRALGGETKCKVQNVSAYRGEDSDFTCHRFGDSCDQLSEDLQKRKENDHAPLLILSNRNGFI